MLLCTEETYRRWGCWYGGEEGRCWIHLWGQIFQEPCLVYVEVKITCESHIASNYFHKRKSFPLVCFVCGNQNPMDIPLDVIASHSSAHPVCMMCSQKGYKPRLRKKSLLGKRKNWLGINLQCVLFQSVHVILSEPVYFIKYMAVWNFCLFIFFLPPS